MAAQKKYNIDIVMLSKFSKMDGGRETWLYNFLPELLKDDRVGAINIFGFRGPNEVDNSELLSSIDNKRVFPHILSSDKKVPSLVLMLFLLKPYLKKIRSAAPDITLGVGGLTEVLYLLTNARFKKGKTVAWLRTIYTHEKANRIPYFLKNTFKNFEKWTLNKVDVVIANGEDTKKFYEQYGLNITLIKNSIHPRKWEMPLPSLISKIRVAYIGRLSKVKGIEEFFALITSINNSPYRDRFEFHVIGEAFSYTDEVTALHDRNLLIYHGPIKNDQLPDAMTDIDVCVALTFSSKELGGAGLSNALLEQMAAGKIILAWSNDAFNQILNTENAYLAKQFSVPSLHEQLTAIYDSKENAIERAKKAKAEAQNYTIESHVEKFKKATFDN